MNKYLKEKKMRSEVVFRILWEYIFHELFLILNQHEIEVIREVFFWSNQETFLQIFFLADVNIKYFHFDCSKIILIKLIGNWNSSFLEK